MATLFINFDYKMSTRIY